MVPPISVVPKAQLQMIFHEIQAVAPDGIMLSVRSIRLMFQR